jgi:hypothetical protein
LNAFILAALGKPLPWAKARIFKTKIRRNIKLAESPSFGQHIIAYEPTSHGAADHRALAREILEMDEPPAAPHVRLTVSSGIDVSTLTAARIAPLPSAAAAMKEEAVA